MLMKHFDLHLLAHEMMSRAVGAMMAEATMTHVGQEKVLLG